MSERREKIESLIKEYRCLLYDENIQWNIYHQMENIAVDLFHLVKPRIDEIIHFFKSLPQGKWQATTLFSPLRVYCKQGCQPYNIDHILSKMIICKWCDYESGVAESMFLKIRSSWVLEDDIEAVKNMILRSATQECRKKEKELAQLYYNEKTCRNKLSAMLTSLKNKTRHKRA